MNKVDILKSRQRKPKSDDSFQPGDVVYWGGDDPFIGRIYYRNDYEDTECYATFEPNVDSCHVSNLRFATPEEVLKLGNRDFLYLGR